MTPKISVVVPVYNEEAIIADTYRRLKYVLDNIKEPYELIFADDGSTDGTLAVLEKIRTQDPNVQVLSWNPNRGMGFAHRALYERASGNFIVEMDADLSTPATIIPALLDALEDADVAIASRYLEKGAEIPLARKIASRAYYAVVRCLFGLHIHDTQSGFAAFRKEALKSVSLKSEGFEIHVELLAKLKGKGFKIIEIPAPYVHRSHGSKFSLLRDGPVTLYNTLRVWLELK